MPERSHHVHVQAKKGLTRYYGLRRASLSQQMRWLIPCYIMVSRYR